jgi:hypothetical protein
VNQPHPIRLNNETPEEKAKYYNKDAANIRREQIKHQVKMFLDRGGKITKVESPKDAYPWQK